MSVGMVTTTSTTTPPGGGGCNDTGAGLSLQHLAVAVAVDMFPAYMRLAVTAASVVVLLVGVVGNVLVPLVVSSNRDMRNSTNMFLVNLSIADLLVLVTCVPTVLTEIHSKPETWVIGYAMCKIVHFVELAITNVSALTILAISFERYYAICQPLQAGYTCTRSRAVKIICVIWVVTLTLTSPVLHIVEFKHTSYIPDGSTVAVCVTQADTLHARIFFYAVITLFFIVPLVILVVIYTIITRSLMAERPPCYSSSRNLAELTSNKSKNDRSSLVARKQVITMLVAVVICFFVCLAPLRGFQIWVIIAKPEDLTNAGFNFYYNFLFFCRVMFHINSAINPVLYNVISSKFRKAFKKQLHQFFVCSRKRDACIHHSTLKTTSTNLTNHSNYPLKKLSSKKKLSDDYI